MKKTIYDTVVLGDINLDWCTRSLLSFPFADLAITEGVVKEGFEWVPIDELPGGSGLNFARFAQEMRYSPLLLGKIGDDPAGRFIYEWLRQHGLESGITVEASLGTGRAFIARDHSDIRLLVNNAPNANKALSVSDIEQYTEMITLCKVLYISGYCLMDPQAPRTRATLRAMQIARDGSRTRVVFDVVPHRFYKIYQFSQFRDLMNKACILVSGVPTMRRLLNLGKPSEKVTGSVVEETVECLMGVCDGFILRLGPSGCDEQVVWDAQSQTLIREETGHDRASDKRGYGDRLTLKALEQVFKIMPAHSDTSSDGAMESPRSLSQDRM